MREVRPSIVDSAGPRQGSTRWLPALLSQVGSMITLTSNNVSSGLKFERNRRTAVDSWPVTTLRHKKQHQGSILNSARQHWVIGYRSLNRVCRFKVPTRHRNIASIAIFHKLRYVSYVSVPFTQSWHRCDCTFHTRAVILILHALVWMNNQRMLKL